MNLISMRNHALICPICGDVQHSLDNLAAHLTQHIERIPSQIGNNLHAMQCDANNAMQNAIVPIVNSAPSICNDNIADQFAVEPNLNGNLIRKFEVTSPLPPTTPYSPPVSPLQSLNIAATEPSSHIPIQTQNDRIAQVVQPFVCNLCDGTFRSKHLQQMHMQLVHEIGICRSRDTNNSFENAGVSSSGAATPPTAAATMQPCYWCPKRFKTIGSLRLHVRMVHGASHVPQIICTPNTFICETAMDNNSLVPLSSLSGSGGGDDEKVLTKTGDPAIASSSAHDMNSNHLPLVPNNPSDYYRNYGLNDTNFGNNGSDVGGAGSSSSSNNGNNGDGTPIEQNDTDKPYNGNNNNSKEMTTIAGTSDDRIHKCDICNKRFTTKYFLKKHKRLHTGKMN